MAAPVQTKRRFSINYEMLLTEEIRTQNLYAIGQQDPGMAQRC